MTEAPDAMLRMAGCGGLAPAQDAGTPLQIGGVPDGAEALILARMAAWPAADGVKLVYVARDANRLQHLVDGLEFFAPELKILAFQAWDCLPYDRASPNTLTVAGRLAALSHLLAPADRQAQADILLTTANAALQKVPPRLWLQNRRKSLATGSSSDPHALADWLGVNGYSRASSVVDMGDFAVRGGLLDIYPPGCRQPVRLDFFGDQLETIRSFDPETQISGGEMARLDLLPVSEIILGSDEIARFRRGYLSAFGADQSDDHLYQSVSEGRRAAGMEHWLPLYHDRLETLFDYCPSARWALDVGLDGVATDRLTQIEDHYQARLEGLQSPRLAEQMPYKPLPPDALYLTADGWKEQLERRPLVRLSPFQEAEGTGQAIRNIPGRVGRNFAADRAATARLMSGQDQPVNVFDAAIAHLRDRQERGKRVVIACCSPGSRDRIAQILADRDFHSAVKTEDCASVLALPAGAAALAVFVVERGFEMGDLVIITEQDILGDRLIRPARAARRGKDIIRQATTLREGDLVIHAAHGIARFIGLRNLVALGVPHDCLELAYAGGDKLYLPVENIELLSRYGGDASVGQLDRLGGTAWQARRARVKKRILEMADQLVKTAAARALRTAPKIVAPGGAYDEFASRFAFDETPDQIETISAVLEDLGSGRPMDRLVCGDVGFGKTEIALRAAFAAAMDGRQVALIAPTTLLCRQHHETFGARFAGLPLNVVQLSRLQGTKANRAAREAVANGTADITVATHALLAPSVKFRDLGLLIIDEEQHFGVRHKERLKELKSNVHVLTLSATPIPRTLQLAMSGVRDLSLIATPPVDRLAIRTLISPFDPMPVREALMRERNRGGQSFYVCPRISDLAGIREFLEEHTPELKCAVAHGQMPPGQLDDVMSAFYDGRYDVLVSTTIIESGLDIPRANTIIVHRAEMFGLSQLYQLRGRVGRSKLRAHALFTISPTKPLTATAEQRLKVLQSLETLGAGFQLASHDLDIRGAGNLLGDAQSGHINEVGFELYQNMFEEAVASLKSGTEPAEDDQWSPQINIGVPVLIPQSYIEDLPLRLELYRRLGGFQSAAEIDAFAVELVDRFGSMPAEVALLLKVVRIKHLCRRANVDRLEAGPKGVVVGFRDNIFADPAGLIAYVSDSGAPARIRPDHKIVFTRNWHSTDHRLAGLVRMLHELAALAEANAAAA